MKGHRGSLIEAESKWRFAQCECGWSSRRFMPTTTASSVMSQHARHVREEQELDSIRSHYGLPKGRNNA